MASLVLGVAGAAIGATFGPLGASIGWMIGSAVGSMLDPPKSEGPRLTDLKLQNSQYGQMRPLVYGAVRIAGNVIWQTDLQEHKSTKNAGKGGGGASVTTYTYSASFAIRLCDGPLDDVLRIWADGRLVYDKTTSTSTNLNVTVYLGDETQLPDPTMEAALGTGEVPAYRGVAYVVFNDLDLSPYGNRIPSFTFETATDSEPILKRLTLWDQEYQPGYWSAPWFAPAASYDGNRLWFGQVLPYNSGSIKFTYLEQSYSETGTLLSSEPKTYRDIDAGEDYMIVTPPQRRCINLPPIWFLEVNESPYIRHPDTNPDRFLWLDGFSGAVRAYKGKDSYICAVDFVANWAGTHFYMLGHPGHQSDGAGTGGGCTLRKFSATGLIAVASRTIHTADSGLLSDPASYYITIDTDGTLWVGCDTYLWHLRDMDDGTFDEIQVWTDVTLDFARGAAFCNGLMIVKGDYDIVSGYYLFNVYDLNVSGPPWDVVTSFTVGPHSPGSSSDVYGIVTPLGNGLVWVQDGVISVCGNLAKPVTLASIVTSLSIKAGLTAAQIDVSELTDLVAGYVVGNQMSARAALEPLMIAYAFDAVESDGIVKFVKRGGAPVAVTVSADDLAAYEAGSSPPATMTITRGQDVDLPQFIDVLYLEPAADYQQGTQSAQRATVGSQSRLTVSLPIVLDAEEAAKIANVQLYNAWLERDRFSAALPAKYAMFDACDVIVANGRTCRIVNDDAQPGALQKLELVRAATETWDAAPTPGSGGFEPPGLIAPQFTQLIMLDIPYGADASQLGGYFAAMQGYDRQEWAGAGLYKSIDGGVSYEQAAVSAAHDTIGATTTLLGDFTGNWFDELNIVTVVLGKGAGELESATELAVLNGANLAVIGRELLQYKNAVLTAARTYVLSGLLRGRYGTEWATSGHAVGETFVLLPTSTAIPAAAGDYGNARYWKAVTAGMALASADVQQFTYLGAPLAPYAPVHLGIGRDSSDNATLTWTRRARYGGAWADYQDVPLCEASESYTVTFWTDATYTTDVATYTTTTPSLSYTAAQQTADFGSPQAVLCWTVKQNGTVPTVAAPIDPPPSGGDPGALPGYRQTWWQPMTIPPPAGANNRVYTSGVHTDDLIVVSFTPPANASYFTVEFTTIGPNYTLDFAVSLTAGDFDAPLYANQGATATVRLATVAALGTTRVPAGQTVCCNIRFVDSIPSEEADLVILTTRSS